ncbi:PepSY-associated TM helix domain-containing protein [Algoriphagus sp. A40]|uniref:PepSY-associated TM helix domain-containing protein n=1 Tax=Algoriphagus sp. A40 TaxID=1945863 RepID=UPI000987B173|nr:PepSY-associated TM helix domain-containing protein [Algoriphagus sp. A40]OOG72795.1 peptidase [Algoriphagus sp. A40]
MTEPKVQSKVKSLRWLRSLHKWLGIPLIIFFFLIGITSILLAWKKKAELLPPTLETKIQQGNWISPAEMVSIAEAEMAKIGESTEVDRIDIRPDKGVAKVTFKTHFTEVQLDGFSGEVLSIETRHSDWIEKVHDGSIVDFYLGGDEATKLTYSTLTALGLILMGISGFYLWYFPKVIRRLKGR